MRRLPGSETVAAPFVGRERELTALRGLLDATLAGQGGLVLLSGAAGIGKTTLVGELCREANTHGATVLIGRAYDLSETQSYGPWFETLAHVPQGKDLPPTRPPDQ